ncbi:hypothetical protein HN587_02730 [Candidatus Woesearchaeota archaeon]|jgi:hypothetical protein|nr:hypothetical protein [Candidatus Woesearchaeota archaeon]
MFGHRTGGYLHKELKEAKFYLERLAPLQEPKLTNRNMALGRVKNAIEFIEHIDKNKHQILKKLEQDIIQQLEELDEQKS